MWKNFNNNNLGIEIPDDNNHHLYFCQKFRTLTSLNHLKQIKMERCLIKALALVREKMVTSHSNLNKVILSTSPSILSHWSHKTDKSDICCKNRPQDKMTFFKSILLLLFYSRAMPLFLLGPREDLLRPEMTNKAAQFACQNQLTSFFTNVQVVEPVRV